ncbi:MAG: DUF1211 domain-containing protein [Armatimonadetes bacterium]|nr:DUF1211 domain-containing protein [Armatimonadota bacterium]
MTTERLEAFTDGVIAIIITVMLLEFKTPTGSSITDLQATWPLLVSYTLSYVNLGIYWNNHHHMFQAVEHLNGRVLWANLHLLFWLSMIPFATNWASVSSYAPTPVAIYGIVLLLAGAAYSLLTRALVSANGKDSVFAKGLGSDTKGFASLIIYTIGVGVAHFQPYVAFGLYVVVAVMWFIPDRRFERARQES